MKQTLFLCLALLAGFDSLAQITPLNYTNASNWAAHPMKLFDLSIHPSFTVVGPDTTQQTLVNIEYPPPLAKADVFAVSPTTLIGSGGAAGTIPLDLVQKSAINLAIQLNFSQFGRIGRIYAPYYRQANLATFSMPLSQQNQQAAIFDTAATDVLAAFTYYMQHDNGGKPVVLLGHSQGSLIIAMMLHRMEQNPAQYGAWLNRITVAALAGMEGGAYVAKGENSGGWLENLGFCENEQQASCLMPWMTVKDGLAFVSSTPPTNHVPDNSAMVGKNLKHQAFSPGTHEQSGDPLGFTVQAKAVKRSIYPKIYVSSGVSNVGTDWVAYDQFYEARVTKPNNEAWGIAVKRITLPGDERFDPIEGAFFADLHLYDLYILIEDVLTAVEAKLTAMTPVSSPQNTTWLIYANPATDRIRWENASDEVAEVQLLDVNGRILEKGGPGTSEFAVPFLPGGVYFLHFRSKSGAIKMEKVLVANRN